MAEADYVRMRLEHGAQFPYHDKPPKDWAERAALGVLADLLDRRGIKNALWDCEDDKETTEEIVTTLGDIIRAAHNTSARLNTDS